MLRIDSRMRENKNYRLTRLTARRVESKWMNRAHASPESNYQHDGDGEELRELIGKNSPSPLGLVDSRGPRVIPPFSFEYDKGWACI